VVDRESVEVCRAAVPGTRKTLDWVGVRAMTQSKEKKNGDQRNACDIPAFSSWKEVAQLNADSFTREGVVQHTQLDGVCAPCMSFWGADTTRERECVCVITSEAVGGGFFFADAGESDTVAFFAFGVFGPPAACWVGWRV
jgi:hypothetical protein